MNYVKKHHHTEISQARISNITDEAYPLTVNHIHVN